MLNPAGRRQGNYRAERDGSGGGAKTLEKLTGTSDRRGARNKGRKGQTARRQLGFQPRSRAGLIAFGACMACTATAEPPVAAASPEMDRTLENLASDDCPYRSIFVFWEWPQDEQASPESKKGADLTTRVGRAFAKAIEQQGFHVVPHGADEWFYWMTVNQARENLEAPGAFIWVAHTQALKDLEGRFRLAEAVESLETEKLGVYGLFQYPIAELEDVAEEMAERTAAKIRPHVSAMCEDWQRGNYSEEARLERIRQELVREIERMRAERARRIQRGELELEIE